MVTQVIQESVATLELKASQVIQGLKVPMERQGIREYQALAVIPASLVVLVIQEPKEILVTADLKESLATLEIVDTLAYQVSQAIQASQE